MRFSSCHIDARGYFYASPAIAKLPQLLTPPRPQVAVNNWSAIPQHVSHSTHLVSSHHLPAQTLACCPFSVSRSATASTRSLHKPCSRSGSRRASVSQSRVTFTAYFTTTRLPHAFSSSCSVPFTRTHLIPSRSTAAARTATACACSYFRPSPWSSRYTIGHASAITSGVAHRHRTAFMQHFST
jgi:hypothetical protein